MAEMFVYDGPAFSELKPLYDQWTWQELKWGWNNRILSEADIRAFALEQLDESDPLFELVLDIVTEEKYSLDIKQKLENLCQAETPESESEIRQVWRNVTLLWITRLELDDKKLEDEIQLLFATFHSPDDMSCLIRWMPARPGEVSPKPWNIRAQLEIYKEKSPFFKALAEM